MNARIGAKKNKTLRIRASDSLHERLMKIAAKKGQSASDLAREVLDEHLTAEEKRIAEEGGAFPMGPLLTPKAEGKTS